MYSDFFGLRHPPFEDHAEARYFLSTPACETILAAIEEEAPLDRGITLILGEAGGGKTILIRTMVLRYHCSDHVVVLTVPEHGAMDLPREVCKGFGLSLPSSESRTRCLARLRRYLKRTAEAQHRAIVIVDQAENLSAESLEDLGLLAGLQSDHRELLSIILVGQARLRTLLDEPQAAPLRRKINAEHTLARLTLSQTHRYVEHRLRTAGAGETSLFDKEAVALIHEAARGIPRLINRLCHAAMLAGYGAGETRISRAITTSVTQGTARKRSAGVRELGLQSTASLTTDLPRARRPNVPDEVQHNPAVSLKPAVSEVTYGCDGCGDASDAYAVDDEPSAVSQARNVPGHDYLGRVSEALIIQGEGLLDRLERALAKAEGVTTTTDAFLDQYAATERRLAASRETTEQACERADQVESRLSSFAEELADNTDRVQESVAQLMAGIGAGEDMRDKLEAMWQEVSRMVVETQKTLATQQTELNDKIEETKRVQKELTGSAQAGLQAAAEDAQSRTSAAEERFRQVSLDLQERFAAVERGGAEGAKAVEDKIEGLLDKASSAIGAAEAKVDALSTRTEEEVVGRGRTQVETAETTASNIESLLRKVSSTTEAAEERIHTALKEAARMKAEVETALSTHRARHLEMMKEAEESRAQSANAALAAYREKLREQLEEHERTQQRETAAARDELEAMVDRASSASTEADAAVERLSRTVQESVEEARQLYNDIAEVALADHRKRVREQLEEHEQTQRSEMAAARNELEALVDRASSTSTEADAAVERLARSVQESVADAGRLHANMAKDALGDHDKRLREQLEEHEQTLRSEMASARNELMALTDRASSASTEADAAVARLSRTVQESVEEARQQHEHIAKGTLADSHKKLQEQVEAHERVRGETAKALDETMSEHRRSVQEMIDQTASRLETAEDAITAGQERLEQSLANGIKSQEERTAELKSAVDEVVSECELSKVKLTERIRTEVDETLTAFNGSCAELLDRARRGFDGLSGQLKTIETRRTDVESSLGGFAEDLERTVAEVNALKDTARQLGTTLETHTQEANTAKEDLSGVVAQAEKMLLDVEANRGRIETLRHIVADSLVDVGGACEKANQAQEQARYYEQVIARLGAVDTESEQAEKRLREIVEQAGQIEEAMRRMTLDAEGKVGQLDSHTASASHVLRQLGDANVIGHRLVAEVSAAGEAAAKAKEQMDRTALDTRSITETAGATANELANCNAHAAELIENLEQATAPAVGVTQELDRSVEDARQQLQRLVTDSKQAGKLVEGLDTLARMLKATREVDATVRRSVDEARAVHEELTTVNDNVLQQTVKLQNLNETAGELIAEQERPTLDARASSEQLARQLASAEDTTEVGRRLLNEFAKQADTIRQEIEAQRQQSMELETTIARMSAGPAQIVANAQSQAAQLEQVCSAVQKIFAGLSQASLDARKSMKQFEGTKQEAAQRLNQLMEHTQRASTTLHEWVEEAMRVQSRLERTLKECPPVWETHPGETLQDVSWSVRPRSRIANRSATGGGDAPDDSEATDTLKPGEASKPVEAPREKIVAKPSTRADEITQMIDDAKRATARVES